MKISYFDKRSYLCVKYCYMYRVQIRNRQVDKAVAKMRLIRYVDTALFYVYLEFLIGVSISICKKETI